MQNSPELGRRRKKGGREGTLKPARLLRLIWLGADKSTREKTDKMWVRHDHRSAGERSKDQTRAQGVRPMAAGAADLGQAMIRGVEVQMAQMWGLRELLSVRGVVLVRGGWSLLWKYKSVQAAESHTVLGLYVLHLNRLEAKQVKKYLRRNNCPWSPRDRQNTTLRGQFGGYPFYRENLCEPARLETMWFIG